MPAKQTKKIATLCVYVGLVFGLANQLGCGGSSVQGPNNSTSAATCNPEVDQATLDQARSQFDADVLPIMQAQCASCHAGNNVVDGPDFLGAGPAEFHDQLVSNRQLVNTPKNSLLILKGAHTGPALTPNETKLTRDWIQTRSGGDCATQAGGTLEDAAADKPQSLEDALARFSRCMTLYNWENTNVGRISEQQSSEGACRGCHNAGLAGVWMSSDPAAMWEINRRSPYVLKWITSRIGADGALEDLVPSGRLCAKGVEALQCEGSPTCHPKFNCSATVKENIDKFLELTLTLYRDYANEC